MAKARRREIRLDAEVYRTEGHVFSVTIGTLSREPVFEDRSFGISCIQILRELRSETGNPVYAYCLMPDHAHLLVGITKGTPLPDFIGRWKSLCYKERRDRGDKSPFWQRSFFDHALRQEDDLRAAALYILLNPVRKGLVENFRRYPLCGSLEWDLEMW